MHEMAVNLHGPYYMMRLLIPTFRAQRRGCVLNIASRAGTLYIPFSTGYCASKAALINLTGCVQKEIDMDGLDDIHLYALHPGGVQSEMTLDSKLWSSPPSPPPGAIVPGEVPWIGKTRGACWA